MSEEAEETRVAGEGEGDAGETEGESVGNPASDPESTGADPSGEVEELREQLLRKQAELVNFRRRTQREAQERRRAERLAVLRELLPVIDDVERAATAEAEDLESYREGVELILRSIHDVFSRLGVERIEPAGEPFDPNLHEAVERQETDAVPEGHVSAVYKPGYLLEDRLLRAAMVAVASSPEGGDEAADRTDEA